MSDGGELRLEKVASRYELSGQAEWQKLLRLFQLSEGFSLLVLLVLDVDGAALCQRELEQQLKKEGKQLFAIEIPTPEALRLLPSSLLETDPPANAGCVWIATVEPDYGKDYPAWRDAAQFTFARLNAHRNSIRRHFNLPLVFVGAPWLQEVMREIAPDLWSVRTLVFRIEPPPQSTAEQLVSEPAKFDLDHDKSGADPIFALKEAEKLRGEPGKELSLARLLYRAGEGFASRHEWPSARKAYAEALELNQRAEAAPDVLIANLDGLAIACTVTGHYRDSISYLERELNIAREIGDQRHQGKALGNLGVAYYSLGDPRKASEFFAQQLVITREIRDRRGEGNALGNLGNAYYSLGEPQKAIEFYEQLLNIAREIGDRRGEGNALFNSAIALDKLGDRPQAIARAEASLQILKEIESPMAAKVEAQLAAWKSQIE